MRQQRKSMSQKGKAKCHGLHQGCRRHTGEHRKMEFDLVYYFLSVTIETTPVFFKKFSLNKDSFEAFTKILISPKCQFMFLSRLFLMIILKTERSAVCSTYF